MLGDGRTVRLSSAWLMARNSAAKLSLVHAAMYLSTLHQIPEEEWEEGVTILPPHTSPFAKLFTSSTCMQVGPNKSILLPIPLTPAEQSPLGLV